MKIKVIDIVSIYPNCKVTCRTEFGDIALTWMDANPSINKEYDIEFDANEILIWKNDIIMTELKEPAIYMDNNEIVIIGTLESVDDDGLMVVRMGDYILTFETQGEAYHNGTMIKIKVQSMEAYPFSYS